MTCDISPVAMFFIAGASLNCLNGTEIIPDKANVKSYFDMMEATAKETESAKPVHLGMRS